MDPEEVHRVLGVLIRYQPDPHRAMGQQVGLAMSTIDPWAWEEKIGWMLAYLGRYGRVSPGDILDRPSSFVLAMVRGVSDLLRAENERPQSPFEAGREEWT